MKNNIRFDLSDWLIHFFRNVDLNDSSSIVFPEHMGWGNIYEDVKYSALFMLRSALRNGRLWATWSYRGDVRTIYGSDPAVCFTDMPIPAFLEASRTRERKGEAMSSFALVFPKAAMHGLNANHVIYGLDAGHSSIPSGNGGGPRIIDPGVMAKLEQYRYVSYTAGQGGKVDWTHEREWRWPFRGDRSASEGLLAEYGTVDEWSDIPGLDFYQVGLLGMGVIVKTSEQAEWIVSDILTLVDRGTIVKDQFSFVIATDALPPLEHLRDPKEISDVIAAAAIDLVPHFSHPTTTLDELAGRFQELVDEVAESVPDIESGEGGGCWLWLLDNSAPVTRALVKHNYAKVSLDGRYLVRLPKFSQNRGLRQREKMTQLLADKVAIEFELECGYFSVLNSTDFDKVPFYNGDHTDNNRYYNFCWIGR
jgi:hypothetical protein